MENTKKIILYNLFFLAVCYSCTHQKVKTIKNTHFLTRDSVKNVVFKAYNYNHLTNTEDYFIKNDSVFYKYVVNDGEKIKISKIVDVETFDLLYNDSSKHNSAHDKYSVTHPLNSYFKDTNYVYIYQYLSPIPVFFKAGKSSDYTLLGGSYVKIGNCIYWRGERLEDVNIETFKTLKVIERSSEREAFIGVDANHIYSGNNIMTLKIATDNYYLSEDLIAKYF